MAALFSCAYLQAWALTPSGMRRSIHLTAAECNGATGLVVNRSTDLPRHWWSRGMSACHVFLRFSRPLSLSDIEIGHRSASVCLLGSVAYRSQQRVMWDVARQEIREGPSGAGQYLARHYRAPWVLQA